MLKKLTDCSGCARRREKLLKYASIAKERMQALYVKNKEEVKPINKEG